MCLIIRQMQALLALAEFGSDEVISDDDLELMRGVLAGLHRYLALFDKDLGEEFARDCRLPMKDGRITAET